MNLKRSQTQVSAHADDFPVANGKKLREWNVVTSGLCDEQRKCAIQPIANY